MNPDFATWLKLGLGRAAVFLKSNDARPYREVLLHACTHDLTYAAQCEDSRAVYLWDLIQLSGDEAFYRKAILKAMDKPDEDTDLRQLSELAGRFARQGDEPAKRALYRTFSRCGFACAGRACAQELIRLDGAPAMVFVCGKLDEIGKEDHHWILRTLMETLRKRDRRSAAPPELKDLYRQWRAEDRAEKTATHTWPKTVEEARQEISVKKRPVVGWVRRASREELADFAGDLVKEADPGRLTAYLRSFCRRAFPGPASLLIQLSSHPEERVARAAVVAMEMMKHADIRDFALKNLEGGKWQRLSVDLLVRNGGVRDYQAIEALLQQDHDRHDMHSIQMGVKHFVKTHPSPKAKAVLLLAYEKGPCTFCRTEIVERMAAAKCLTRHLREECRYDACEDTRKFVKRR
jgi:hypothetical protein